MKKTKKTIVKSSKPAVKKTAPKHEDKTKVKKNPEVKLISNIQEFKDQLEILQIDLAETVRKKKEEVIPEPEVGDEADIAVRSVERDLTFETGGNELHLLEEVEAALRRIEKGIYGICEACGKPIAEPRLRAMPYARYCVNCQSRFEHI